MPWLQFQFRYVRRRDHRLGIDGIAIFDQRRILHGECLLDRERCVRPCCSIHIYSSRAPGGNKARLAAVSRSCLLFHARLMLSERETASKSLKESPMKAAYY